MFLSLYLSYVLSVFVLHWYPICNSVQRAKNGIREATEWICFSLLCLTCHIINLLFPNTFKDDRLCVLIYSLFERKCVCGSDIHAESDEWLLVSKSSACRANSSVCGMRGHLDLWHQKLHTCVNWSTHTQIFSSPLHCQEKKWKMCTFRGTTTSHWGSTLKGQLCTLCNPKKRILVS